MGTPKYNDNRVQAKKSDQTSSDPKKDKQVIEQYQKLISQKLGEKEMAKKAAQIIELMINTNRPK